MNGYRKLATDVLLMAIADAEFSGPARTKAQEHQLMESIDARRFLCGNSRILQFWCAVADVHPDDMRGLAKQKDWCR